MVDEVGIGQTVVEGKVRGGGDGGVGLYLMRWLGRGMGVTGVRPRHAAAEVEARGP